MNKYKLMKFDFTDLPLEYHSQYPFSSFDRFIMLGEIEGMHGHCIVSNFTTGQIHCGYHTDNFVELIEGEL